MSPTTQLSANNALGRPLRSTRSRARRPAQPQTSESTHANSLPANESQAQYPTQSQLSGPTLSTLPTEIQIKIFSYLVPVSSACLSLTCRKFYAIHKEFDARFGKIGLQTPVFHQGKFIQLHELLGEWMGKNWIWGGNFVKTFVSKKRFRELEKAEKVEKAKKARHSGGFYCVPYCEHCLGITFEEPAMSAKREGSRKEKGRGKKRAASQELEKSMLTENGEPV